MKLLSIIIPAYNSERNIEKMIHAIEKVDIPMIKKEIIIVNDCSTDKTKLKIKNLSLKIKDLRTINHTKNTGKGGAVITGLKSAKGDIFFLLDDDLEYDPRDIPKVINPILKESADIVYGIRILHSKKYSGYYNSGRILLNKILSLLLKIRLSDPITGSKAFTRNVLKAISPLKSKGFEIESEITAKAIKHGFIPLEVTVSYKPRNAEEGKNIRWHHALPLIWAAFRYKYL